MPTSADGDADSNTPPGVRRQRSASLSSTCTSDKPSRGTSPHRNSTTTAGGTVSRNVEPLEGADTTTPMTPARKQSRREKRDHTKATAPTPSASSPSSPGTSLLLQRLSEVELQFQLEQDRPPRLNLAPRDVANLILWSVPAPIPIIESPRVFFIKNKSQVRNAVVIYVNGWSYDEMLCTGVGLPRSAGHNKDGAGAPARSEGAADAEAAWNAQLCGAMLAPVREQRCWARPGRGSGCAGGVQYCPLFIPSTRDELEKDLWWRNDAPRRAGPSSSSSSRPGRPLGGGAGGGDGEVMDAHRTSPAVEDARGVGSLFQQAMRVHGSGDGTSGAAASPTQVTEAVSDAFQAHQNLWQDRALLRRYALHLPEHAVELQQLGFTITAPPSRDEDGEGLETAASVEEPQLADREADDAAHGEVTKAEEEAWIAFTAPESFDPAASPVKVFALDCEMVQVEGGTSALARATLVDVRTGAVALDLLVKPRRPVTDYLTRFSGITAAMLDPVTTTLADFQRALQHHIDAETFVVGHSLENDFKACRCLPSCYVLDTTWLFPHPAGLPYKHALRFLAQRFLNRRIQQGAHDSAIDALVSAELAQLKLIHGPSFGIRPRVSVLGLIAEAAGDSADADGAGAGATAKEAEGQKSGASQTGSAAAAVDVRVQLFDDPVVLGGLLPPAASPTTGAEAERASRDAQGGRGAAGRIDAVPVRHDEDAMRKVVRALQRRAAHLQTQRQQQAATAGSDDTPSFSLFWVQLTQAKVDVVLPSAGPPPPPQPTTVASAALEPHTALAAPAAPATADDHDEGGETDTAATAVDAAAVHTAAQFRTVHDTNRRVLRIIEACPEETLVVVLTGRCAGEASGNHLSRAQGTCFAFVKDSTAPGPRAEELARLEDEETVEGRAATAGLTSSAAGPAAAAATTAPAASAPASHKDSTPPACQQQ